MRKIVKNGLMLAVILHDLWIFRNRYNHRPTATNKDKVELITTVKEKLLKYKKKGELTEGQASQISEDIVKKVGKF